MLGVSNSGEVYLLRMKHPPDIGKAISGLNPLKIGPPNEPAILLWKGVWAGEVRQGRDAVPVTRNKPCTTRGCVGTSVRKRPLEERGPVWGLTWRIHCHDLPRKALLTIERNAKNPAL